MNFVIEGMTCVGCSSSIENALREAFTDKGMTECKIMLLTHKMKVLVLKSQKDVVTPEKIIDEVESIGFEVSLFISFFNVLPLIFHIGKTTKHRRSRFRQVQRESHDKQRPNGRGSFR